MSGSFISVGLPLCLGFFALGAAGVYYEIFDQTFGQYMFVFGAILLLIDLIILLTAEPIRLIFSVGLTLAVFAIFTAYFTPEPLGDVWSGFTGAISDWLHGLWDGFTEWIGGLLNGAHEWLLVWWWTILLIPFAIYGGLYTLVWISNKGSNY